MGHRSLLVAPGEAAPSRQTLGINVPSPVLAVIGTTTDLDSALDAQLLPAVLAAVDVVARSRAVFVTGGTDAGVFHLLRMAIAVASSSPAGVVGVAPDGLISTDDTPASPDRVDVDPGLTALVRVKGEHWGDETPMLSRVVTELAAPGRAAVLLLGGGDGARVEVREHLRQRRPIVVLGGSGRLADEIAAGIAGRDDEELGALLASGDVRIVPLSAGPDALRDRLGAILRRRRRWRRRPGRRPARPCPPRRVPQAVVQRSVFGTAAPRGGSARVRPAGRSHRGGRSLRAPGVRRVRSAGAARAEPVALVHGAGDRRRIPHDSVRRGASLAAVGPVARCVRRHARRRQQRAHDGRSTPRVAASVPVGAAARRTAALAVLRARRPGRARADGGGDVRLGDLERRVAEVHYGKVSS